MSEKDVELEKSLADVQGQLADLMKANEAKDAQIAELVKAKEDAEVAELNSVVEGFSFVAEDEREELVKCLRAGDNGAALLALHKAQTAIVAALGEQALPEDEAESVIKAKGEAGTSALVKAMQAIKG